MLGKLVLALSLARRELWFQFDHADIINRDSPSGHVVHAESGSYVIHRLSVGLTDEASLHVFRVNYPPAPAGFEVSPDVETMWYRYDGYRRRREPLASMAYMCLTVLIARRRWAGGGCH